MRSHNGQPDIIYELYQIRRDLDCDYRFASYAFAKDRLRAKDYSRVYTGRIENGMDLEDIYMLHNLDDRPLRHKMHSLSMSDVIILHEDENRKAYYVDAIGFQEVPEFVRQLNQIRKDKER